MLKVSEMILQISDNLLLFVRKKYTNIGQEGPCLHSNPTSQP